MAAGTIDEVSVLGSGRCEGGRAFESAAAGRGSLEVRGRALGSARRERSCFQSICVGELISRCTRRWREVQRCLLDANRTLVRGELESSG